MKTTENLKNLPFSEEETLACYNLIYSILNQAGIKRIPLVMYTLIYIGVQELRDEGIPMDHIIESIASVEEFREKGN